MKTTVFSVVSLIKQSNFKDYKKRVILYKLYAVRARMCSTNQAHLKYIECQINMVSSLWHAAKINQLENVEGNV